MPYQFIGIEDLAYRKASACYPNPNNSGTFYFQEEVSQYYDEVRLISQNDKVLKRKFEQFYKLQLVKSSIR